MSIEFPCPHCGALIVNVPDKYAGQKGRCLHCKKAVTIPSPPPPPPPSAPIEVLPEVVPEPTEPVSTGYIPRSAGSSRYRKASNQRYPSLRKYCEILTVLSYVTGVVGMVSGIVVILKPLLVSTVAAGKPAVGPYEAVTAFVSGLVICLGTYLALVLQLAFVDLLRVLMDIEENTRKVSEKG